MKISEKKLLKIIKEEVSNFLKEIDFSGHVEAGTYMHIRRACENGDEEACGKAQQLAKGIGAGQFIASVGGLASAIGSSSAVGMGAAVQAKATKAIIDATQAGLSLFPRGLLGSQSMNIVWKTLSNLVGKGTISGAPLVMRGPPRAHAIAEKFIKKIFDGKRKLTQSDLKKVLDIVREHSKTLRGVKSRGVTR